MASKDKIRLHHFVGIGKCLVDGAGVEMPLEGEVIAERGMNHRRCRVQRRAHVRHRLEFLIFDHNDVGTVLSRSTAGRHDGRDSFALPADVVDRDRALRRGFETF
jgi:hypothetical protein